MTVLSAAVTAEPKSFLLCLSHHKIATAEQFFSLYPQAVPIFKIAEGAEKTQKSRFADDDVLLPPAPQPAVEAAPNLPHFGIDFM